MPNPISRALQGLLDAEANLWETNDTPTPNGPRPNIYPRPLLPDPALNRGMTKMDRVFPQDAAGVDVTTMPWTDPDAGSNVLGSTDVRTGPQHISVNPALTLAFPQSAVDNTLAHELEHVRQNRTDTNPSLTALQEAVQDYWSRPSEIAARKAANRYGKDQGDPDYWRGDPSVLRALPKVRP